MKIDPNMTIDSMKEKKYMSKEDCGTAGIVVTISDIDQQDVSMENEPTEMKWVLWFEEDVKPLILNKTNIELIADALGENRPARWVGHQIVCYNDPQIMFAGKRTGGIRVRGAEEPEAPKAAPSRPKATAPKRPIDERNPPDPEFDDDIPFGN